MKLFDIPKDILNDNERQRRVYSTYGIAPTVLARSDSAKIFVKNEIIRVGNVSTGKSQGGMVYGIDGVFPTLCACTHGNVLGNVVDDRFIDNKE